MNFTAAPDATYTTPAPFGDKPYTLHWQGYGRGLVQFSCSCERFAYEGHCGHSLELSVLYGFAARHWGDAASTFHSQLPYYIAEYAKLVHAGLIRCDRPLRVTEAAQ